MKLRVSSFSVMIALGAVLSACTTTVPPQSKSDSAPASSGVADARAGLKAGVYDAGTAAWNVKRIHALQAPPGFFDPDRIWSPTVERELAQKMAAGEEVPRPPSGISFANSDLAFSGTRVVMGNFHGFNIYDAPIDADPSLVVSVVCPGGQGDVSVHGDLLFYSVEQNRGRIDCGGSGVAEESSAERFRGVRIFDISDVTAPVQVAAVQTCRGSHTHTLVPHPTDSDIVYIYGSGTAGVRPGTELEGCSAGEPEDNPDTALYSIDVIKVPLSAPEKAAVINRPRIFADRDTGEINGLWRGGKMGEGAQTTASTIACHDITVYPAFDLAGGACSGNGILLDISDPENPMRIDEIADLNMAYWHSATFSNDATKILFTDEWGGGVAARCRPEDPETWGANLIVDITDNGMEPRAFFKIPGTQTAVENCVAHNGSLIPVPGRDIMVQGWYSGGLSIIDFTDSNNPFEIAYFDQGPVSAEALYLAGYWAAYWHYGRIFAPEIVRGLDIFELVPSEFLSKAEIEAAEMIMFEEVNTQTQLRIEWPNSPVVAQALIDQLRRNGDVDHALVKQASSVVESWRVGEVKPNQVGEIVAALTAAAGAGAHTEHDRLNHLAGVLAGAK